MTLRPKAARIAALVCIGALVALQAAVASAHEGEFSKFDNCPSANTEEVKKCLYAVVEGGEVVMGTKKVPIVNPVTIQAGIGKVNQTTFQAPLFAAINGADTLSKTPQPVPGGLLGIVPPEDSPWIVKQLSKFFFENGLTGVNATLEPARPANEALFSERSLLFRQGVAFKLPVRMHLQNPFLGSNCFVGSPSNPIILNLTTGKTEPPPPNTSIEGSVGAGELIEEGLILKLNKTKFVDNAWAAPKAEGCGGILSFLVDPIINAQIGLPSAAGHNSMTQISTSYSATTTAVNAH